MHTPEFHLIQRPRTLIRRTGHHRDWLNQCQARLPGRCQRDSEAAISPPRPHTHIRCAAHRNIFEANVRCAMCTCVIKSLGPALDRPGPARLRDPPSPSRRPARWQPTRCPPPSAGAPRLGRPLEGTQRRGVNHSIPLIPGGNREPCPGRSSPERTGPNRRTRD
jgi:hypothetical protein